MVPLGCLDADEDFLHDAGLAEAEVDTSTSELLYSVQQGVISVVDLMVNILERKEVDRLRVGGRGEALDDEGEAGGEAEYGGDDDTAQTQPLLTPEFILS